MNRISILLVCIICLLLVHPLLAQQQQIMFGDKKSKITIGAQYRETNGDIVSAATLYNTNMLVFKTDRYGNLLWVFKDTFLDAYESMRIGKLANNDYLIMNAHGRQMLRIRPNDGSMVWTSSVLFSTSLSHEIRGFAELPNGNIVVCGFNDDDYGVSSKRQYEGFLAFFDSAGTFLNCKYYGHTKTSIDDNYSFYDVAYLNNKIYVAGAFGRYDYSYTNDALLMSMDMNGNLLKTSLLQTPFISGTDTMWFPRFTDLSVVDGKLYVHGSASTRQIMARVDTATFSLSGYYVNVKPYPNFYRSHFYVKDSTTFYSEITTGNTPSLRKIFLSKIQNGLLSYCKKVENDSLLVINSMVAAANDTLFIAGRVNSVFKGYSAYFQLSDTSKRCGFSDTIVTFTAFTKSLVAPVYAPNTHPVFVTSFPYYRWGKHCIYSLYLCGDKLCPNVLKANLDTPSKTELCIGDTVLLRDEGCYPKTWYRNGVAISDTSNFLKVYKEGAYMLVVNNNVCADTAKVLFHKKFNPIITQSGDTLFSSKGVSYQWLDKFYALIGGATSQYFVPTVSGTYFVRVKDSSGCEQISDSVVFDVSMLILQNTKRSIKMLEVYPNPSYSHIHINNKTGRTATLIIKDLNGNIIISKEQLPGIQEYELGQLGIKSGPYLVQLFNGQIFESEKLVVKQE